VSAPEAAEGGESCNVGFFLAAAATAIALELDSMLFIELPLVGSVGDLLAK
jgi:hypothetical protein